MKIKKIKNNIEINDIYSWDDLMSQIPYRAEDLYDIEITTYGFVHDVGTQVILTRATGDPKGWKTAKQDFREALKICRECWDIAAQYAYH